MLSLKTAVVAAFGTLFLAAPAQSAEYPDQQITMIVPLHVVATAGGCRYSYCLMR